MHKYNVEKWSIVLIALGMAAAGCSRSASAVKGDRSGGPSNAPVASSPARSLAVTVPNRADEPVKVTVTTSTTTTTIVIIKPPEVIPSDLLFAFDSAVLSPEAEPALAVILAPSADRVVSVRIEGHTDADGSEAYNQDLSLRRAQAVRDWFVGKDVPATVITVTGWGETKPVAPDTSPDNKGKNRRVAITMTVRR